MNNTGRVENRRCLDAHSVSLARAARFSHAGISTAPLMLNVRGTRTLPDSFWGRCRWPS